MPPHIHLATDETCKESSEYCVYLTLTKRMGIFFFSSLFGRVTNAANLAENAPVVISFQGGIMACMHQHIARVFQRTTTMP